MAAARAVDAVTFDFWNTMIAVSDGSLYERRLGLWLEHLEAGGHDVDDEQLRAAFGDTFGVFQEAWKANRQFTTDDAVNEVLAQLEIEAESGLTDTLQQAFLEASRQVGLRPAPGLADTLGALEGAGVRIGIICDVGMSTPSPVLRDILDRFGLLDRFDHWSFSDEVGVYKPDPTIFEHALAGLGTEPGRTAHIGDLRRTDVGGARGAGWVSVRYRGLFDDGVDDEATAEIEAHHVIDHHDQLLSVLSLI